MVNVPINLLHLYLRLCITFASLSAHRCESLCADTVKFIQLVAPPVHSSSRYSPVGVHQGHSNSPREEPGSDEVGGPSGRGVQVPQVRGRGSDVGPEEEEQQHDL